MRNKLIWLLVGSMLLAACAPAPAAEEPAVIQERLPWPDDESECIPDEEVRAQYLDIYFTSSTFTMSLDFSHTALCAIPLIPYSLDFNFSGSDLRGIFVSSKPITRDDLGAADLGYEFGGGKGMIENVSFIQANLSGSYLANARIINSNLSKANLHAVDLSNTLLDHVNFSQADLTGINLSGADLAQVNFSYAILQNADFRGAKIDSVTVGGADLSGADLRGVDLSDLKNYETMIVEGALYDSETVWPEDYDPAAHGAIFTE